MISVTEAINLILDQSLTQETEEVELIEAMGRVLAEPVLADRDSPPFHRVTMDGIAIHSSALKPHVSFYVENIQAAGQAALSLGNRSNCIEVMTGAILPENTDCVIPYEQIKISDGKASSVSIDHQPFQNVHLKGTDAKAGEILLEPGQIINPGSIGLMAAVGISRIRVQKMPKVAVCSTGDELIDLQEKPEIHQIRKSNAYMLEAALLALGLKPDVYHIKDDREIMVRELGVLVQKYGVILFSGAVSKGKYDFLPSVLQELGMKKMIHGVFQRPGKPFLFGVFPETLIFGFPGNPASTFVCFHTYFKPWLMKQLNLPAQSYTGRLGEDVPFKKQLTYHLLVSLKSIDGSLMAFPIHSSGSGDLVHLAHADGVISLPPEKDFFNAGEVYPIIPFGNKLF